MYNEEYYDEGYYDDEPYVEVNHEFTSIFHDESVLECVVYEDAFAKANKRSIEYRRAADYIEKDNPGYASKINKKANDMTKGSSHGSDWFNNDYREKSKKGHHTFSGDKNYAKSRKDWAKEHGDVGERPEEVDKRKKDYYTRMQKAKKATGVSVKGESYSFLDVDMI